MPSNQPALTVQDFVDAGFRPEQTRLVSNGAQHVWYYVGNDLEGYVRHADVVLGTPDKFFDFATRRPCGMNRMEIDGAMALLLTALVQLSRETGKEVFNYPNDFPKVQPQLARGFTTNYNYLAHFGLCIKDGRGKYRVSQLGFDFFDGIRPCSEYVICNEDRVLRQGGEVFIHELLDDIEDIRVEPLWWELANA